jgi:hypothetical protein
LVGGAKYTQSFKGEGEWLCYLCVSNLSKREALSIERIAKNKRRKAKGKTALARRLDVLIPLLGDFPNCSLEYFQEDD